MSRVFVGIGSNINRRRNIRGALGDLRRDYPAMQVSTVYESPAVGFDGAPFYNLVASFHTDRSPQSLHEYLIKIEQRYGREDQHRGFNSRNIDLDLLLYDDLVQRDALLYLPREDILQYDFVLRPLQELAPDLLHPVTGISLSRHWQEMPGQRLAMQVVDL